MRKFILGALTLCVLIVTPTASAAVTQTTDTNWAGSDAYTANHTAGKFNRVAASWVEPAVTCPTSDAAVDFNVALSGAGGDTVFAGSQVSCNAGIPGYTAYWYIDGPYSHPQFPVSPGDHLTAKVAYVAPYFVITVSDATSGLSFTTDQLCPSGASCLRSTADVFISTEGQGGGLPDRPQARYNRVTFTAISLHDNHGHTGGFLNKNWLAAQETSVLNGHTLSTPSALSKTGSTFYDTWQGA